MAVSAIDCWANFLDNEKLSPTRTPDATQDLIRLCEAAGALRHPDISSYLRKCQSRLFLVGVAMDLGIDLPAIRSAHRGTAMGRGLLDAWLEVYKQRFGDTYGTKADKELIRRGIKTKLAQ